MAYGLSRSAFAQRYRQNGDLAKTFARALALLWLGFGAAAGAAEPVKVAVLGDSLVAGYGLAAEEGLVAQLQEALTQAGVEVALQNAGVSGDTTAGGRARLAWTLAEGAEGLIVLLGGNDMLRGMPLEQTRENLHAIVAEAEVPVMLLGMPASANFGESYQRDFVQIYQDLAGEAVLFPDYLAPLAEGLTLAQVRAHFMQSDGIHPNAAGVAKIVEALAPEVGAFILTLPH